METKQRRLHREPHQIGAATKMGTMETATKVYPNITTWWFQCIEDDHQRDHRQIENFYYECLYDILRPADTGGANLPALKHLKAKIVKLHSQQIKSSLLDNSEADKFEGEQPTLYHPIKMQYRHTAKTIRSARDEDGLIHTWFKSIALALTTHFRTQFDTIAFNNDCVRALTKAVRAERSTADADILENPSTLKEYTMLFTRAGEIKRPEGTDRDLKFTKPIG